MNRVRRGLALLICALAISACDEGEAVQIGGEARDFSATNLATGKEITFGGEYRGGVTLVNVWATYCGPCRQEIPSLQALYKEFGPLGLRIAAVSIDTDSATKVAAFMKEFGVTFDVLYDPQNTIQSAYHSEKIPESFLIGRDHKIVKIVYGAREWTSEGMRQQVASALAAKPE